MKRYVIFTLSSGEVYQTDTIYQHILDDIRFYKIVDTHSGKELTDGSWYKLNELEEL